MFTREQTALKVASQAVGAVGWFGKKGHTRPGCVLHSLVVMNVAEQEIAIFLPPKRALRRSLRAAETVSEVLDRFGCGYDLLQRRIKLLDACRGLGLGGGGHGGCSCCEGDSYGVAV